MNRAQRKVQKRVERLRMQQKRWNIFWSLLYGNAAGMTVIGHAMSAAGGVVYVNPTDYAVRWAILEAFNFMSFGALMSLLLYRSIWETRA